MSEFKKELDLKDVGLLIEAMDFWENSGNREFHILQFAKNVILPDEEDEEAYNAVMKFKSYFLDREKDILADKALRQENATFIKTKLFLMKGDMSVDQVFQDASSPVKVPVSGPKTESQPVSSEAGSDQCDKLQNAEKFLTDSGIFHFYENFLDGQPSTLQLAEQYIEECGMKSNYEKFLSSL